MLGVTSMSRQSFGDGPERKTLQRFGSITFDHGRQNKRITSSEFEEYTEENWDAVSRTNLKGTFLHLARSRNIHGENGEGSIVNFLRRTACGAESEFIPKAPISVGPQRILLRKAA